MIESEKDQEAYHWLVAKERVKTATDVVRVLDLHYEKDSDWLTFPELRIGTGFGKNADQRIDYWAMHALPSMRFLRVAYEIKVSRSDLLKELRTPLKRRCALLLSNEFYLVTPPDLVRPDELPIEAGLLEVWHGPHGFYLKTIHPAPHRDTPPPSWRFVASLVRRSLRRGL